MSVHAPISELPTHEVTNQPPAIGDQDLYGDDLALQEALVREGAGWAQGRAKDFGAKCGAAETVNWADQANRYTPEIRPYDPQGRRLNVVDFHPAYHQLMDLAITHETHNLAWRAQKPGGHVAQMAMIYLFNQVEGGVACPMAMSYAAVPVLRQQPDLADEIVPLVLSNRYDKRDIPVSEKSGATIGMFMTEKQGGSDVRANSTKAQPIGAGGPGGEYALTGHKWFCSGAMSDAFLSLAYTDNGLSCFYMPRWRPDGTRNTTYLQRIKDKMGNRSNATVELELDGAWGRMVGEEGRGIATILNMVQHTRLFCIMGTAALMRQALTQAIHHVSHRAAFQKMLIQQPLMQSVIADLAVESEAATALMMRVARSFDEAPNDPKAAAFQRVATAIGKYWVCKRGPTFVFEAMECHGGPGYVEESVMARLYREAPVNSIWEGSGNVMCLDVLRAMHKDPSAMDAVMDELKSVAGANGDYDAALKQVGVALTQTENLEARARWLVEKLALLLQAAQLIAHAPDYVSDTFCASRLASDKGLCFGAVADPTAAAKIIERAAGR